MFSNAAVDVIFHGCECVAGVFATTNGFGEGLCELVSVFFVEGKKRMSQSDSSFVVELTNRR